MTKSFSDLKKSRQTNFQNLQNKIKQLAEGQNFGDEDPRYWQPTVDKEGNGFAVIRFLPSSPGDGEEALPFVMIWDHGFQGPGGWYIEKSLTTLGQPDPCAEMNNLYWTRNKPGDRDLVSGTPGKNGTKRRLTYTSNILVVNDPDHSENNGKVFLYRYGRKLFEKIKAKMEPDKKDSEAAVFDPFDLWGGANFKIRIAKVGGYRNYDESHFDVPTPACKGDEEAMKKAWESTYSLKELVDPKNFKSYAELKAKLNRAMAVSVEEKESVSPREYEAVNSSSPPWNESESNDSSEENDPELAELRALLSS